MSEITMEQRAALVASLQQCQALGYTPEQCVEVFAQAQNVGEFIDFDTLRQCVAAGFPPATCIDEAIAKRRAVATVTQAVKISDYAMRGISSLIGAFAGVTVAKRRRSSMAGRIAWALGGFFLPGIVIPAAIVFGADKKRARRR